MTSCDELRAAVVSAKARRNDAMRANAQAEDASQPAPYTTADMDALRLAVDVAALEARNAGCDVSDLVGPHVGQL